MLSLPAHTSHRLQPLDKSLFKSSKHHFNEASEGWMCTHPSSVIKQADIAGLLGVAYPGAASMATVLHGFEACGLRPPDCHKIREEDYVAMEIRSDEKEGRIILEENDEEIRDTRKFTQAFLQNYFKKTLYLLFGKIAS
ncbi:hypothetical protein JTB14_011082 [Gonioctena quinquepunctata]|nr:hypothetical protein JTB14_011082 [Gonioctena quinquepunctata]